MASNLAVPPPDGVEVVQAPAAADLAREVLARDDADVVVMAAAVADYRPAEPAGGKRPKDSDDVDDRRSSRPRTCSPSWAGGGGTASSSWASPRTRARTASCARARS